MVTSYLHLNSEVHTRDYFSYIIIIPVLSGYFLFRIMPEVKKSQSHSLAWGLPIVLVGSAASIWGKVLENRMTVVDSVALANSGAVLIVIGAFIICYGKSAFRIAIFPLLFILFAVPLPNVVMRPVLALLQAGTSAVTEPLFKLTGVPFLREGNFFYLETVSVEVAEQCSGIKSSLSLLILSVLAGKMFLASAWRRTILAMSVLPITIFKNGVRVVTLSLLGAYVDERILTHSTIHSNSGILIFILPLTLLGVVLWVLKRGERKIERLPMPGSSAINERRGL
jgi:exosortase